MFRGHKNHGMIEPRYGAAVVGYSAFSESYSSKSEQVVEYGGLGGKPYKEGVGEVHQLLQPAAWNSSPHDRPKKDGKSSPRVRPGSAWKNVHVGNSPPSKNHSPGKYDNYTSDESDDDNDNVVCDKNGYCYPKPKHDDDYAPNYGYYKPKPNGNGYTTPPPQPYYETSKPNRNGYTTPPQQPYYETSKPKEHDYSTPPPQPYYEAPDGYPTPPPQPYYEAPDGYPTPPPQPHYETSNKKAMVYKPLPSVKTKRPNKGTLESQVESMRINSPMSAGGQRSPKSPYASSSPRSPYSSSPLKDQGYRETINSREARSRRYSGAAVGAPEEQYKGTIDHEEAARRYRGIFLKY